MASARHTQAGSSGRKSAMLELCLCAHTYATLHFLAIIQWFCLCQKNTSSDAGAHAVLQGKFTVVCKRTAGKVASLRGRR